MEMKLLFCGIIMGCMSWIMGECNMFCVVWKLDRFIDMKFVCNVMMERNFENSMVK